MTDPDRIWIQPNCCVDPREGRIWCEDDVWPDCGSHDEGGVEYIRADLAMLAKAPPPEGDVGELIERLRVIGPGLVRWMPVEWSTDVLEAADALTRLQAEVTRLTTERELTLAALGYWRDEMPDGAVRDLQKYLAQSPEQS